ncbi:MAG: substrate-binding domain-containing protein [Luteitalea sp.]|nr:substrate-binding domain-containing protein [Luteitalea sp.]
MSGGRNVSHCDTAEAMVARNGADAVQAVQRACRLLRAFQREGDVLRLRDLVERTAMHKATASRLLRTLESEGLVERVGAVGFRSTIRGPARTTYRIGFATRGVDTPFSRAVTESVERAAMEAGFELVMLNSHRSARTALRHAEAMVREAVHLVIEFQSHERMAPLVAARFIEAGIPVIAIEIPHPGATFFGANNYQAGLIGGRAMGRWIKDHWHGRADAVMLLREDAAGALPRLRVSGMLAGVHETLPAVEQAQTIDIDGQGSLEKTFEAVRRRLRLGPPQATAVLAANDPMALGAIRAFEEAGRATRCVVMGQNASQDARMELRRKGTPLIGSVAYFPERYGDSVIRLTETILAGKLVPPAMFTRHELVTTGTVDSLYPLDERLPQALSTAAAP